MSPSPERRLISWGSRTCGVLVLVFFFFAPWFRERRPDRPWGQTGLATLTSRFADAVSRSPTLPGRALLENAAPKERRNALLTLITWTSAGLAALVPASALALVLLPERRSRVMRLLLVTCAAAASSILMQGVLDVGVFATPSRPQEIVGAFIWAPTVLIPFLAVAAIAHMQFVGSWRWESRAMRALAILAAVGSSAPGDAPLHDGALVGWGLQAEVVMLALAILGACGNPASSAAPGDEPLGGQATPAEVRRAEVIAIAFFVGSLVFFGVLLKRAFTPALPTHTWFSSLFWRPCHESRVTEIAFSPGGDLVATGDAGGTVKVWSTRDGSLVRAIDLGSHGAGRVFALRFAATGGLVAAVDLYDARTSSTWGLGVFAIGDGAPTSVTLPGPRNHSGTWDPYGVFSPKGDLLASDCHWSRLSSVSDGSMVRKLAGRPFAFGARGDTVALGVYHADTRGGWRKDIEVRRVDDDSVVTTIPFDDPDVDFASGEKFCLYRGGDEMFAGSTSRWQNVQIAYLFSTRESGKPVGEQGFIIRDAIRARQVRLALDGHRIEPFENRSFGFRSRDGTLVRLSVLYEEHDSVVFAPDESMVAVADGNEVELRPLP